MMPSAVLLIGAAAIVAGLGVVGWRRATRVPPVPAPTPAPASPSFSEAALPPEDDPTCTDGAFLRHDEPTEGGDS